jgi:hypothetical protein
MTDHGWRASSFSQANDNSNCVELAGTLDAARDSKNPEGAVLAVAGLRSFLAGLKAEAEAEAVRPRTHAAPAG